LFPDRETSAKKTMTLAQVFWNRLVRS